MEKVQTTPATDPRYPDAETQKIAEEMEKMGHKLPFKLNNDKGVQAPVEDKPDEEAPAPKEDDAKKDDAPEPKVELEDQKPNTDKPSEDKPEDHPKADQKETLIVAQKREIKEWKKKFDLETSTLKQEIEKLQTQIATGSPKAEDAKAKVDESADKLETMVQTIVEANEGVDPVLVKSILEAAKQLTASGNQLPQDLAEKIDKIVQQEEVRKAEDEERDIIAAETTRFNEEFSKEIVANDEIKKLIAEKGLSMDEVKESIRNFIYSEQGVQYAGIPLSEVFTLKKSLFIPEKRKTAEHSRGGASVGESSDSRPKTAAEIAAMTPEEFEKYSNDLAKNSRSRVMRHGRPIQ